MITLNFKFISVLVGIQQLLAGVHRNFHIAVFHYRCNGYIIAFLMQINKLFGGVIFIGDFRRCCLTDIAIINLYPLLQLS